MSGEISLTQEISNQFGEVLSIITFCPHKPCVIFTKNVNLYLYIYLYLQIMIESYESYMSKFIYKSWERNRHYPSNWQFVLFLSKGTETMEAPVSPKPQWDVAGDGYVHSISAHQKTQASRRFRKWNQCERLPTLCKDFADFFGDVCSDVWWKYAESNMFVSHTWGKA